MVFRILYSFRDDESTLDVDSPEIVIGRPKPGVQVDLDLSPDLLVSRPHARIGRDSSGLWIEDLGSMSGTLLNNRDITGQGRHRITSTDVVIIGETKLCVLVTDQSDGLEDCDMLLSYDHRDAEAAYHIRAQLQEKNLRVWMDEVGVERDPGRIHVVEETLRHARCAAVLVGPHGVGPFQEPEVECALAESRNRDLPLVTILLPGAQDESQLGPDLRHCPCLDFRESITSDGIDHLVERISAGSGQSGAPATITLDRSSTRTLTRLPAGPTPQDRIGQTVGGCRILDFISQGGMGTVYRARQVRLDRIVAIKMIRPEYSRDEMRLERFRREALAVGRFNSPHVVQVHDAGLEQGVYYLVMEYIDGGDLGRYAAARPEGVLSVEQAMDLLGQATSGLMEAERIKVIHRDIKPQNILMDSRGVLKITDFGLARFVKSLTESSTTAPLTRPQQILGTPLYMSPEQVGGLPVDHRSDMYSLGATFYHVLTGDPPFEGDSCYAILGNREHVKCLRPGALVGDESLGQALAAVIEKMTSLDREDRYPTFEALQNALSAVAGQESG